MLNHFVRYFVPSTGWSKKIINSIWHIVSCLLLDVKYSSNNRSQIKIAAKCMQIYIWILPLVTPSYLYAAILARYILRNDIASLHDIHIDSDIALSLAIRIFRNTRHLSTILDGHLCNNLPIFFIILFHICRYVCNTKLKC